MPLESWIQHSRVDQFLYDWQTVIAGVLAFLAGVATVVAAIWAIWATRSTAREQIAASRADADRVIAATREQTRVTAEQTATTVRLEQERVLREVEAIRLSVATEIRWLLGTLIETHKVLVRLSEGGTVTSARDVETLTEVRDPVVYPASADRIGLLGSLAPYVAAFYGNIAHLQFVRRVTGSNPDELVQSKELNRVAGLFELACRNSLPLLAKLPQDEAFDADLKAKIEAMRRSAGPRA
jgi:hypothetical protein